MLKKVLLAALLLTLAPSAHPQSVTGGETNKIYSPPTAQLAVNSNALTFAGPTGLNTFLMDVQPTVSAKISITNETANACNGVFQIIVSATHTKSSTFNNAIQLWQIVPLVNSTGAYAASATVNIPATTTINIVSSAISGNRMAVQVVNTTGACSNTSIDVTVVLSVVSITSPLLSVGGSNFLGTANQVEGLVSPGVNGASIDPVIGGALQPPTNASFLAVGVDNFGFSSFPLPVNSGSQTGLLTPPVASQAGEWALAFLGNTGAGTVGVAVNAPWSCIESGCSDSSSPQPAKLSLLPNSSNALTKVFTNVSGEVFFGQFIIFDTIATVRQHQTGNQTTSQILGSNTLAGSTLALAVSCSTIACAISPTDTQLLSWKQINPNSVSVPGAAATKAMSVWVAGPTSAAADTVTFNVSAGTVNGSSIIELTGLVAANPNTPSAPFVSSNPKFSANETDPGGLFIENGGYSYGPVTQTFSAAGTFLVPLWQQAQHGVFSDGCFVQLAVTAASGTTPTLNTYLQDTGDNVHFDDRASFPQATAAATYIGGVGTGAGGFNPVLATDGTLAVATRVDGPIGPAGRLKFVVGGTTPSFTVTYTVSCQ